MTFEIALVLGMIAVAVVLFASEKLRPDIIALLVLLTLIVSGLLSSGDAFAGFASPAVITVWAVFIVSEALFKTGVADYLGEQIIRLAGNSEVRLIVVIMLICGVMSSFMNNIGAAAILLPAVAGAARKSGVPLSRLLIPLSFASLMGGNMTLIGTPPNILAASILSDRGLPSFGFFDFTPTGILIFGTGVLYMALIGRHLLPVRRTSEEQQTIQLREYVSEMRILPQSILAGKDLEQSRLGADFDLTVMGILREGEGQLTVHRDTRLESEDLLIVEGRAKNIVTACEKLGMELEAKRIVDFEDLKSEDVHMVEAVIAPKSRFAGKSLKEMRFRDKFGFTALAIWRQGEVITRRLSDVRLRFGDALLLQGPRYRLPILRESNEFLVLEPLMLEQRRPGKATLALGIVGLVLLLTTALGFHISTAMVIGAVLAVLTGCLTMDEAYRAIEWRSVFLIAGMLSLGVAMDQTGTARFLADGIVDLVGGLGPLAVLAGLYILASLITEPMSNAAATVLIVPIAIDVALSLGANPQPFVLATVIGASTSFLTPIGHQANVLVFGPGGYKFTDFTRVGSLLNIILFAVTMIFLPLIWPLQ
jgi:di/tricarboxylate transporter